MLLKPKQTKYRKYHKGRISYNIRTNQNWLCIERGQNNENNLDNSLSSPLGQASDQSLAENLQENGFKYGIVALEPGRITASNINAIELAIKRKLKSDSSSGLSKSSTKISSLKKDSDSQKLELRIFPHIPVTKKPIEVRMGKGKGNIDYWMTRVKSGAILLEFNCSNENLGKIISKIVNSKLPIKTKFISR
jgi:large subunit ribosomal protein L16